MIEATLMCTRKWNVLSRCIFIFVLFMSKHAYSNYNSESVIDLSATHKLDDNVFSDNRWSYGWRDEGTSDTRPKLNVVRGAFNGRDAIDLEVWYPNSSGEFVDYFLQKSEQGSEWSKRKLDYLSFWYKAIGTEGEVEIRLNHGKRKWKQEVPTFFTKIYVEPDQWRRVIIPFEQFRNELKKGGVLENTSGIDNLSIGYRNHELRSPGRIMFANFTVGRYQFQKNSTAISLPVAWFFSVDKYRPDGTKNDFSTGRDKEGYGDLLGYQSPEFDASKWQKLDVGKSWESQGFNYDGPAWYRVSVFIPENWRGSSISLSAGAPDDRGDLYWNGKLVKHIAKFGDSFTGVRIGNEEIRFGENNLIAVRVIDWYKSGGLTKGPFEVHLLPVTVGLAASEKSVSVVPLENFKMGAKPAKKYTISIAANKLMNVGSDARLSYRISDCFHRNIALDSSAVMQKRGEGYALELSLDQNQTRRLFYGELIDVSAALLSSDGSVLYALAANNVQLDYSQRDNLALQPAAEVWDETPYGRLKLIDSIDASKNPDSDAHPYIEGGVRDSWVGSRAYSRWESGIVVKQFKNRGYREANNNEHFAYRVGTGSLRPHAAYLLRVSFPDNVARYQVMHIKSGRNDVGTGFRSGTSPDDPKGNYPQTQRWQWYDHLVINDDVTYGFKGGRSVSSNHGFWVAFHDIGRAYLPEFQAGPAVGEIKLYEIPSIEKTYPHIILPEGLPHRLLMADWERLPDKVAQDVVRQAKFLGLNAIAPTFLAWGAAAYFENNSGYQVPSVNAWNSATALSGEDNHKVYEEYLNASKASGLSIIPRLEYGGSPSLPKKAWVIGKEGTPYRPGRYASWGANILHPDTWRDMEQLLDDTVGSKVDKNPQIAGILWRLRSERIAISYGEQDVKLYCQETGCEVPKGNAAEIARFAAVTHGQSYIYWWQTKRAEFFEKIADKLNSYRNDLKFLYYNWDSDRWDIGWNPSQFNTKNDWSEYFNIDKSEEWYRKYLEKNRGRSNDYYLSLVKNFKTPDKNVFPDMYKSISNMYLLAPVHWRYLTDNGPYLHYFKTGSRMAISDIYTYEERGRNNIQNDDYQTSELTPGGEDFATAHWVMALFHEDIQVITSTTYSFPGGFAEKIRQFSTAFLSLPAIEGVDDDAALISDNKAIVEMVKIRKYFTANGTYLSVIYIGETQEKLKIRWDPSWREMVDLVGGEPVSKQGNPDDYYFDVSVKPMDVKTYLARGS